MADLPVLGEYIKNERSFLHDISNQIVIANGMTGLVIEKLDAKQSLEEKDAERLRKAMRALDKMIVMINDRRNYVKSVPVPENQD
ncbi:MAG: hypothetical protein WCG27_06595 [Pseudomonadota bacterium]